jgi:hypothetical protein
MEQSGSSSRQSAASKNETVHNYSKPLSGSFCSGLRLPLRTIRFAILATNTIDDRPTNAGENKHRERKIC